MQIFVPFAFTDNPPSNHLSSKFGGRRPASTKEPRTSWWSPHVALRPSTASARGRGVYELVRTRSRRSLPQSPNIPSATAPEPPTVTRHALTFARRTRNPSRSTLRPQQCLTHGHAIDQKSQNYPNHLVGGEPSSTDGPFQSPQKPRRSNLGRVLSEVIQRRRGMRTLRQYGRLAEIPSVLLCRSQRTAVDRQKALLIS